MTVEASATSSPSSGIPLPAATTTRVTRSGATAAVARAYGPPPEEPKVPNVEQAQQVGQLDDLPSHGRQARRASAWTRRTPAGSRDTSRTPCRRAASSRRAPPPAVLGEPGW